MTEVTLDVKGDGGDLLKLDWRTPQAPGPWYHISANRLVTAIGNVRDALQSLIGSAMDQRSKGQPLALGRELQVLARAGARLREKVFFAVPGDNENEGAAAEEWLADIGELVLHVWIDQGVYIPWGLIYDGEPPSVPGPDDMDPKNFSGFWCLKYQISTLYNRIRDSVVRNPRPSGQARFMHLTNKTAWQRALSQIPQDERDIVDLIFNKQFISSSEEFKNAWQKQQISRETDLLYFFGHASGTALELNKNDVLTMEDFPEILKRRPPNDLPTCMVFLNGCYTAIGDDQKGGFLVATAYRGFCGFVGTEAKIPDVFALRFANHFLAQLLYSGKTAGAIMHDMRLQHWPLSLIYNLSCHPGFRFLKSEQVPPIPKIANLSGDIIGSDRV